MTFLPGTCHVVAMLQTGTASQDAVLVCGCCSLCVINANSVQYDIEVWCASSAQETDSYYI